MAVTRGLLGIGLGLLLSSALKKSARRTTGLAFAAVEVLTTGPILLRLRDALE